jgi:hypothetical protein
MTGLGDSASIAGQYGMSVSEETLRFIGVLELELEIGLIEKTNCECFDWSRCWLGTGVVDEIELEHL